MMPPDTEELIKKVNTLTLDKNRLKQKLTQLNLANAKDRPTLISQTSTNTATTPGQGSLDEKDCSSVNKNNVTSSLSSCIISGVECSTSCEDDLLYMNNLYRKQLEEYNNNWEYIQSKCAALLSELTALQRHFALLKEERLKIEQELNTKCDDYDQLKSELQTVVLNYETQLGAMSEHLSMITSKVSLDDN